MRALLWSENRMLTHGGSVVGAEGVLSELTERSENPMRMVALLLLTLAALQAQINSGVVTGVVTDPHKAAAPNAKVEVVDDNTQFSYSATTNSAANSPCRI
jgi:hypothetical protein